MVSSGGPTGLPERPRDGRERGVVSPSLVDFEGVLGDLAIAVNMALRARRHNGGLLTAGRQEPPQRTGFQSSAASFTSFAIVLRLRAVPLAAAGIFSFECPIPEPYET